jgi:very-short-patch-repair endonuclease
VTRLPLHPIDELAAHLADEGYTVRRELRFDRRGRAWKFDLALPDLRVAVEYEGGTHSGGRHTSPLGYADDCEEYNQAVLQGWRVLRFTADHVRRGLHVTQTLELLRDLGAKGGDAP